MQNTLPQEHNRIPTLHKTLDNARPKVYFPYEYTTFPAVGNDSHTSLRGPGAKAKYLSYHVSDPNCLNPLSCRVEQRHSINSC